MSISRRDSDVMAWPERWHWPLSARVHQDELSGEKMEEAAEKQLRAEEAVKPSKPPSAEQPRALACSVPVGVS